MNIVLFVLLSISWITLLLFYLEESDNLWRQSFFFLFTFIFGAFFLVSGIQFQTGWSFITTGGTTTATIVNADLVASEDGWSYFGWLGIGIGFYGIVMKVLWPFLQQWGIRRIWG